MSHNHSAEDNSADEPWAEENAAGNARLNASMLPMLVRKHFVLHCNKLV